ncbi:MAG: hypothetical protein ACP5RS_03185, partial [Thermoplasmata archaeon]
LNDLYELYSMSILKDSKAIEVIKEGEMLLQQKNILKNQAKQSKLSREQWNDIMNIDKNLALLNKKVDDYKSGKLTIMDDNLHMVDPSKNNLPVFAKVVWKLSSPLKNMVPDDIYIYGSNINITGHREHIFINPNTTIYENNMVMGSLRMNALKSSLSYNYTVTMMYAGQEYSFKVPTDHQPTYVVTKSNSIGYLQYDQQGISINGNFDDRFTKEFTMALVYSNTLRDYIQLFGM